MTEIFKHTNILNEKINTICQYHYHGVQLKESLVKSLGKTSYLHREFYMEKVKVHTKKKGKNTMA